MRLTDWQRLLEEFREVLDCASPLALSEVVARSKAAEDSRSPRRCRDVSGSLLHPTVRWQGDSHLAMGRQTIRLLTSAATS